MYCVERQPIVYDAAGVPSQQMKIVGSAGNIYTVKVQLVPSCNCPDAAKDLYLPLSSSLIASARNHCKHLILVMRRVLGCSASSPHWYQKALIRSELEDLFKNARPVRSALCRFLPTLQDPRVANAELQAAYDQATGKASTSQAVAPVKPGKAEGECVVNPLCRR